MNLLDSCSGRNLGTGLAWLNAPQIWSVDSGVLNISPEAETDFFRPSEGLQRDNASLLYASIEGDFQAETFVSAKLTGWGDAGSLTVRSSDHQWIKLCVEQNQVDTVSVVSVVTNPWSDDANGELLKSPEAYLQIKRVGNMFWMHYRPDGKDWTFVRTFTCEMPTAVMVGVHAQAPSQAGCEVSFSHLNIEPI